jgi:hypothetical protein
MAQGHCWSSAGAARWTLPTFYLLETGSCYAVQAGLEFYFLAL